MGFWRRQQASDDKPHWLFKNQIQCVHDLKRRLALMILQIGCIAHFKLNIFSMWWSSSFLTHVFYCILCVYSFVSLYHLISGAFSGLRQLASNSSHLSVQDWVVSIHDKVQSRHVHHTFLIQSRQFRVYNCFSSVRDRANDWVQPMDSIMVIHPFAPLFCIHQLAFPFWGLTLGKLILDTNWRTGGWLGYWSPQKTVKL